MYNVRGSSIYKNWNKKCYIATKKEQQVEYDEYGSEVNSYNKPMPYFFNIQPVSAYLDIVEYGEKADKICKAIIPYNLYNNKFHEGDIAYLYGATPKGETPETYGINGNYVISGVRPQNVAIAIYFQKIQK